MNIDIKLDSALHLSKEQVNELVANINEQTNDGSALNICDYSPKYKLVYFWVLAVFALPAAYFIIKVL